MSKYSLCQEVVIGSRAGWRLVKGKEEKKKGREIYNGGVLYNLLHQSAS